MSASDVLGRITAEGLDQYGDSRALWDALCAVVGRSDANALLAKCVSALEAGGVDWQTAWRAVGRMYPRAVFNRDPAALNAVIGLVKRELNAKVVSS